MKNITQQIKQWLQGKPGQGNIGFDPQGVAIAEAVYIVEESDIDGFDVGDDEVLGRFLGIVQDRLKGANVICKSIDLTDEVNNGGIREKKMTIKYLPKP